MRGCATALVGSVVLLSGSLGGLAGEEIAGDERVLAGGGVGQAEDQGQVQRVGPGGQRFVEHPVAADALDVDAVPLQVPVEVAPADRPGSEGGPLGDQDVPVGCARPGGAAAAASMTTSGPSDVRYAGLASRPHSETVPLAGFGSWALDTNSWSGPPGWWLIGAAENPGSFGSWVVR